MSRRLSEESVTVIQVPCLNAESPECRNTRHAAIFNGVSLSFLITDLGVPTQRRRKPEFIRDQSAQQLNSLQRYSSITVVFNEVFVNKELIGLCYRCYYAVDCLSASICPQMNVE